MRPPSDTVSAFFACVLAKRWEDAASLVEEQAIKEWRDDTLIDAYGHSKLVLDGSPNDSRNRNPLLDQLVSRPAPTDFGVATVGEMFTMTPRRLFELTLQFACCDDDGNVHLPWHAREVVIRSERLVDADTAEVTYSHVGQSPDELDEKTIRGFQTPWKIRLRMAGGHWRMEVPGGPLVLKPF